MEIAFLFVKNKEDIMRSHHLTYGKRCQIQALQGRGISKAQIAKDIGVHRSTVGRELERNTCGGGYFPAAAQGKADARRWMSRNAPRKMTPEAVRFIEDRLKEGWSPQQISGWLRYRQERLPAVSHERIYLHVWEDKKRGNQWGRSKLKISELIKFSSHARLVRASKSASARLVSHMTA